MTRVLLLALAACLIAAAEHAGPEPGRPFTTTVAGRPVTFVDGTVQVGDGGLATIALPEGVRFADRDDARHLLEKAWNNPPDTSVVGLIMPFDPAKDEDWAVVVSWSGDGHVEDADAADIDYGDLLKDMQEASSEGKDELRRQGYKPCDLLGWAESPHYDSAAKKLFWAKRLQFEGTQGETLNYCVRMLGARGVLEFNTIDRVEALPRVAEVSKGILAASAFTAGNRYEDFKEGLDPVSAGGVAGLIAGGLILKKVGFLAILLKFIKPILLGVALLGGVAWRFFFGERDRSKAP